MNSMSILETNRLRLRPLRNEDLEDLLGVLGDPETMRFYPAPYTRQLVEEWIKDSINRYRRDGIGLWAVELKATGELIGDCGPAVREVLGAREIELGWHVKRDFWRQGLATEAAEASRDWVFRNIHPSRLIALVRPENNPSRRVAEKIGMTVEQEVEYGSMGWVHLVYAIRFPK
jgi:ribosomal-protein-alanine N-acetyltransferase